MPSGSPQFSGPSLLVSEYGVDEVAAYQVDANGDPMVATRREFITGLDGAEGALLDPVTGDFLFSTFGGGSRVIVVRGFRAPPPAAPAARGGQDRQRIRRARHGSHQAREQVRRPRRRRADPGRLDARHHEGARDDRRGGRPAGGLLRRHLQDRPDERRDAADHAQAGREAPLPAGGKASVAAKRKKKRRLWGDGSGNFKTEGKHSAATVVGTKWLVEDRCKCDATRVVTGVVSVRDFGKRKTVRVRAGKKYVARATGGGWLSARGGAVAASSTARISRCGPSRPAEAREPLRGDRVVCSTSTTVVLLPEHLDHGGPEGRRPRALVGSERDEHRPSSSSSSDWTTMPILAPRSPTGAPRTGRAAETPRPGPAQPAEQRAARPSLADQRAISSRDAGRRAARRRASSRNAERSAAARRRSPRAVRTLADVEPLGGRTDLESGGRCASYDARTCRGNRAIGGVASSTRSTTGTTRRVAVNTPAGRRRERPTCDVRERRSVATASRTTIVERRRSTSPRPAVIGPLRDNGGPTATADASFAKAEP